MYLLNCENNNFAEYRKVRLLILIIEQPISYKILCAESAISYLWAFNILSYASLSNAHSCLCSNPKMTKQILTKKKADCFDLSSNGLIAFKLRLPLANIINFTLASITHSILFNFFTKQYFTV